MKITPAGLQRLREALPDCLFDHFQVYSQVNAYPGGRDSVPGVDVGPVPMVIAE